MRTFLAWLDGAAVDGSPSSAVMKRGSFQAYLGPTPGWLVPQSLDIFLPDHNIGIEYQGAQHSTPVDYFGGAKAFELQQERDARKQSICRQHGCVFIDVHPGYQLEQVIARVKDAM